MRKYVKHKHGFEKNGKRTSKSAAKAIITCLIEENDSENANEYFESSDENSNEYSDVQLKFVDENTINLEVSVMPANLSLRTGLIMHNVIVKMDER